MTNQYTNNANHGRHANNNGAQPAGGFVPTRPVASGRAGGYPQPGQMRPGPGMSAADFSPEYYHHPKRKVGKVLAIVFGCIAALLAIAYCGVAIYFSSHFMPNSKIGNIDVSLMAASDAERALSNKIDAYQLNITGDGFTLNLTAKDTGLTFDASEVVSDALAKTNHWAWPIELSRTHDATDAMVSTYNDSGLEQVVTAAVAKFNETATQPTNASVAYDSKQNKFSVSKESVGTALDPAKVVAAADAALADLTTKVTLTSEHLLQPTVLSTDSRLQTAASAANKMITADLKLTMGTSTAAEVNASLISQWIVLGDDLSATLDEDAMTAWVDQLAKNCNTVGSQRTYTRADGKVCTVSGGVYGWSIDYDSLMELVSDGVKNGTVETVEIPYSTSGDAYNGVGGRDWGNRYIDIDLAEQHVRFYDDSGSLVWESDCISGIPDGTHDTSTGVYWINQMQSPGKLTGYENGEKIYESTVQYWMPFDGNAIGLHDADWQPDFGGTMYKDGYGSHGCVNLPPARAAELYALIHAGDCVVSHW